MSEEGRATEAPLLQAIGITKFYGNFLPITGSISSSSRRQIHALLGENGAGKSTLVKIIYGALQPTAGEILWQGERPPLPIRPPPARSASAWCSSISRCSTR